MKDPYHSVIYTWMHRLFIFIERLKDISYVRKKYKL